MNEDNEYNVIYSHEIWGSGLHQKSDKFSKLADEFFNPHNSLGRFIRPQSVAPPKIDNGENRCSSLLHQLLRRIFNRDEYFVQSNVETYFFSRIPSISFSLERSIE